MAFLADLWAYVWSDEDDHGEEVLPYLKQARSYVLFKVPSGGFVGQLTAELVARGAGCLYPHPLSSGYLQLGAKFVRGLRNAWRVATEAEPKLSAFDVRWSVEILDDHDLPMPARLDGPSAEVAMACLLRGVYQQRESQYPALASSIIVTARFRDPDADDWNLIPVGGVDYKGTARRLKLLHTREIVVAHGQPYPFADPGGPRPEIRIRDGVVKLNDDGLCVRAVRDFDEAFQRISLWPHITAHVKRRLAERVSDDPNKPRFAKDTLEACDKYIPLPLSRFVPARETQQPELGGKWEPIADRKGNRKRKSQTGTWIKRKSQTKRKSQKGNRRQALGLAKAGRFKDVGI